MSTTQPATVCSQDLMTRGRQVCVMTGASTAIEAVVVRVRENMRIEIDWHWCGGRAAVLTLEGPERDEEIRQNLRMASPTFIG
jgi:hypothetical protein